MTNIQATEVSVPQATSGESSGGKEIGLTGLRGLTAHGVSGSVWKGAFICQVVWIQCLKAILALACRIINAVTFRDTKTCKWTLTRCSLYVLMDAYCAGAPSESIPQTATQPAVSSPPKPAVSRVVSSTRLVNPSPRPSGNAATKIPTPVVGVKRRSSPHKEESPKKTRTEEVSIYSLPVGMQLAYLKIQWKKTFVSQNWEAARRKLLGNLQIVLECPSFSALPPPPALPCPWPPLPSSRASPPRLQHNLARTYKTSSFSVPFSPSGMCAGASVAFWTRFCVSAIQMEVCSLRSEYEWFSGNSCTTDQVAKSD